MATPGKHSAAEGGSFSALSNEELGELWAATLRAAAIRRTGTTRNFWRELLTTDDVLQLLGEFKRRASERQEEYEAWLQFASAHGTYSESAGNRSWL